ncbi:hypothetical protein BAE44_0023635 [Dichanthelium oligosanthes]|uniref:Uncharacterized protein n=1 Tax=Dichanthelium oligosanthes TaxID=888268 RepID=A0A1E5UR44_9POAL|nr:hypothetical protein BAE44_0023635 [Dichanthelium oligosanthes]
MMKPSYCLCLLLLASILVASSAVVTVSPKETTREEAWAPAAVQPDEAFLARLCEQQPRGWVLPWCKQLHARRRGAHHHLPMPPPSRDGEGIDRRFGVSKRLVPSGPNRLHN